MRKSTSPASIDTAATAAVCLGATAAQALPGRTFRVSERRGEWVRSSLAPRAMATVHSSSVLRAPDAETRRAAMKRLVADLRRSPGSSDAPFDGVPHRQFGPALTRTPDAAYSLRRRRGLQ